MSNDTAELLTLRLARPEDVPILEWWDRQPHVIAAGGGDTTDDWNVDVAREVAWQEILIGEVAGRPIGVIQVIDPHEEETHYWGQIEPNLRALDIWIGDAADLGQGYGSAMMRQVLARCFGEPTVTAVLVDPLVRNTRVHPFYERFGFRLQQRRWFDDDDCLVYRLRRQCWDVSRS